MMGEAKQRRLAKVAGRPWSQDRPKVIERRLLAVSPQEVSDRTLVPVRPRRGINLALFVGLLSLGNGDLVDDRLDCRERQR
jgi:hypothetical protein